MKLTPRNVLMFLSIVINQKTNGDDKEPTWPEGCTFTHYNKTRPTYASYWDDYFKETVAECEAWCGREKRCGMYVFYDDDDDHWCDLYPFTPMMLEKLTGLKAGSFLEPGDSNTGYKNCEAILPGITWEEYDRKSISRNSAYYYKWRITSFSIFTDKLNGMTSEHCQAHCTVRPECRSVTYSYDDPHWWFYCQLFSITITELLETNRDYEITTNTDTQEYPIFKTYDRVYGDAECGTASLKRSAQDTQPSFGEEHRSLADAGDKTQNTLDDQPGQDLVASSQLLDKDGAGSNTGESDHQAPAPESPGA